MPPTAIEASNALDAWKNGATLVANAGSKISNLVVSINDTSSVDASWLEVYSPHKVMAGADKASDVSNTIFPEKLSHTCANRDELYTKYLKINDRAKRLSRNRNAWGTYFERLIRFPKSDVNQLERAIGKLNFWSIRNTTGLVFHLSSPAVDSPRTRGGPCWHFAELLWNSDDTIDLVAIYRNHDFFNKVLGNYIGLCRLLQFICSHGGKQPGKLICHSVHAYFDCSKAKMNALLR